MMSPLAFPNGRPALSHGRVRWTSALLLALAVALPAQAQSASDDADVRRNPYGTGAGGALLLTNSGFGLGGYYNRAWGPRTSFRAELSLGAGKDEREIKFFGYGRSQIPSKANYLLMLPLQLGVQRRLFRETIEDNFRPYLQLTAGPTLGWVYPYFDDRNGNGLLDDAGEDPERTYDSFTALPKGHARFGMSGMLAIGAHFGLSRRVTQGLRIGYAFTYFSEPVQLLEADVPGSAHRYFGTPTISLTFGRLYRGR